MKKNFKNYVFLLFLAYLIPTLVFEFCNLSFGKRNDESQIEISESVESSLISIEDGVNQVGEIVENTNIDEAQEELLDSRYIKVYNVNLGEVMELKVDEYVAGVVAGEMPASFEMEALKAQAITARTYLFYQLKKSSSNPKQHPDAPICTSTHCQVYYTKEELVDRMGEDWYKNYWERILFAVSSTAGQIMTYEDKLIEPLFHSTSGGRTENSEDVFFSYTPYLRSVESPYEANSPKLNSSVKVTIDEFITKLEGSLGVLNLTRDNLKESISLLEISEGGKVKSLKVGDKVIEGTEFRSLFSLNSANFRFVQSANSIEIITTGYGHGVGMSQYGANGMAQEGYNYKEILKHYYTGVEIARYE